MTKGSLLLRTPIVKCFQSKTVPFWAKVDGLSGLNRGLILNLSFISQKGTSLCDFTFSELSRVKIYQPVWPVREYQKKGINK